MVSKRIYGAALILTIDGDDVAADITSYNLKHEAADTDNLTFAEAAAGGGDAAKLAITAIQSTETASFWRLVWTNAGRKAIPFKLAPHGNTTAEADKPHLSGTVDIGMRPALGGDADPKKSFTFEVEWDAKVDRDLDTVGTIGVV